MTKNTLFTSGQVIPLASGEDYTIKNDEVFINDHPYKKCDLEISLSNVFVEEPLTDITQVKIAVYTKKTPSTIGTSHLSPFDNWVIDGTEQTSLASCVENINTAIGCPTSAGVLADILAEIQNTNDILVNQTNVLLQQILDSNVMQEALITSSNTLLQDIRTYLETLHADNLITNQQLADANTELDNIFALLTNMSVEDADFHTALLDCLNDIKVSLDNIDANTDDLESQLSVLITQTDDVESLLQQIITTLNSNSTVTVAKLEEIRVLLASINANTDQIESQLTTIIGEHDQTQVILNQIRIKPNETEILVCVTQKKEIYLEEFDSDLGTFEDENEDAFFDNGKLVFDSDGYSTSNPILVEEGKEYLLTYDLTYDDTNNVEIVNLQVRDENATSGSLANSSTQDLFNGSKSFNFKPNENSVVIEIAGQENSTFDNIKIEEVKSITGSLVKQFDDLGAEILANRKFYIKGVEVSEPTEWCEGACQIDTTALIEQNNDLLSNVYSELQAINGNTDEVEGNLASLQVAINTQTNTLQTAINLVQQEINTASTENTVHLQAIQTDLTAILNELLSINGNIQTGNITINNILSAVNELIAVTSDKLDTINQSIQDNGLTLDAINVSIGSVTDAVNQLNQDLLNSLEDIKKQLDIIINKPNETEILICVDQKETMSLVKEFDEDGAEIVGNRKFYNDGVEVAEPSDWTEGSCALFRLDELINAVQSGNATTNEISGSLNDVVSLLQNIDANTDDVEKLLTEIDASIDAVIPYIDDVEKLLEQILEQVTPNTTRQRIYKIDASNPTITFTAGQITYIDVVILGDNDTGKVVPQGTGTAIEMDSEIFTKYERNFRDYVNRSNPNSIIITKDTTGQTGYMLVEVGLV